MKAKPIISNKPSIFGYMATFAKKHGAVNMTQGAPDFKTPDWIVDRLHFYSQKGFNQYSPIQGMPQLRKACASKIKACYDVDVNADTEIMISCGAVESIFAVLMAYVGKGDEVIYFDPAFDAYPNIVNAVEGISRRLPLNNDGTINLDALAEAISGKTKLIILNSPHNPVGSVISKAEYETVAKLIADKNILLLSDEVYEHIYAGKKFTSALEIPALRKQLIVVQSLGKTYNLTGWRMGVCIAPADILPFLQGVKQFTTFSAPTPMQLALADGINDHPEYWQQLPNMYQSQHQKLITVLKNSRFKIFPWEGSPFQLLDYRNISEENDQAFAERLITEHGIGLVPISSLYETPQHGFLRLCFAKYDEDLIKGAELLCDV